MAKVFYNSQGGQVGILHQQLRTGEISKRPYTEKNWDRKKERLFWELMEVVQSHGYMRAAISTIGRSVIGGGWSIVPHPNNRYKRRDGQRQRLYEFYNATKRGSSWNNIQDFYGANYKFLIAAMYLKLFGQVGFHVIRDSDGRLYGLDHIPGLIVPNVDAFGNFKTPAFYQYLDQSGTQVVEFASPDEVIFITNPDWTGSPLGGTDIESLSRYVLPIDLYLLTAAREYLKNSDRPELVYVLPENTSAEAFDAFTEEVTARWRGVNNAGRTPIVVQGQFDVMKLGDMPEDLPYNDARGTSREEYLATSGVPGAKLGLTESLSSANLRETRREFHESTVIPLVRLLEEGFYRQLHVRLFNYPGWQLKFNNPDFLNAVERATVHRRYYEINVMTPNEIRAELGKQPVEGGDKFRSEIQEDEEDDLKEPQGSPPEGREPEPDDPSNVGEPVEPEYNPRGDGHDDTSADRELAAWRKFALRRFGKKNPRKFQPEQIPSEIADVIQEYLDRAETKEQVALIFDIAREEMRKHE